MCVSEGFSGVCVVNHVNKSAGGCSTGLHYNEVRLVDDVFVDMSAGRTLGSLGLLPNHGRVRNFGDPYW